MVAPVKKKTKAKVSKPLAVAPGSNWDKLKAKIACPSNKPKKHDLQPVKKTFEKKKNVEWIDTSTIVAMDCEMVGVGSDGARSVLARCSIVDFDGNVVYDKHVKPMERVTDFRTHVSGIRSKHLRDAIPFTQCQQEVAEIFEDKILVGHALRNDMQALMLTHPKGMIRDTTKYRPYMRRKVNGTKLFPKSLKNLALEVLKKTIQTGEHDSVEDARTSLELYKHAMAPWEKAIKASKAPGILVGQLPPQRHPKTKQIISNKPATVDSDEDDFDAAIRNMKQGKTKATKAYAIPDAKQLSLEEYDE
ncbi:RNA exonuclease 4 [Thraustotheca clavata]|uniref:RNA exonuclease 4 n=1 Tax=Thraustotheca clavata TaxID=74557 RepID=A0A1V9YXD8_9STRA|nr:RNA exonuclease 4 [Thraustotheca clavata]